jgi:competence ComEA-like helix-hairpin-helix protein
MPPERRAVLLLLGLALAGQGLRIWVGRPDGPPGEVQLLPAGTRGIPHAHRDSSVASTRPLAPGERIDLDRANAAAIARLPRIGLRLARSIVVDREARGPFGSLEALDRVPGIGPGLLAAIQGQVSFSTAGRIHGSDAAGGLVDRPQPVSSEPPRPSAGQPSRLDLNAATAADLERLPFIGAYLARQIVTFREKHGPFPAVDSLVRVPGIGPATLAKVRDRIRVD